MEVTDELVVDVVGVACVGVTGDEEAVGVEVVAGGRGARGLVLGDVVAEGAVVAGGTIVTVVTVSAGGTGVVDGVVGAGVVGLTAGLVVDDRAGSDEIGASGAEETPVLPRAAVCVTGILVARERPAAPTAPTARAAKIPITGTSRLRSVFIMPHISTCGLTRLELDLDATTAAPKGTPPQAPALIVPRRGPGVA